MISSHIVDVFIDKPISVAVISMVYFFVIFRQYIGLMIANVQ